MKIILHTNTLSHFCHPTYIHEFLLLLLLLLLNVYIREQRKIFWFNGIIAIDITLHYVLCVCICTYVDVFIVSAYFKRRRRRGVFFIHHTLYKLFSTIPHAHTNVIIIYINFPHFRKSIKVCTLRVVGVPHLLIQIEGKWTQKNVIIKTI